MILKLFNDKVYIKLISCDDKLQLCDWYHSPRFFKHLLPYADHRLSETETEQAAAQQIREYLMGDRTEFTIPLEIIGTPFQKAVWAAVSEIPYGEVAYYSDIARAIGRPNAVRAVAAAIADNPLVLFIPCHRVIPTRNYPGNYSGSPGIKAYLLDHEVDTAMTIAADSEQ